MTLPNDSQKNESFNFFPEITCPLRNNLQQCEKTYAEKLLTQTTNNIKALNFPNTKHSEHEAMSNGRQLPGLTYHKLETT